jgi:hypothetical protein
MTQQDAKEWYSQKELFEMLLSTNEKLDKVATELEKTQVLIRDYNGLREDIFECRQAVEKVQNDLEGLKGRFQGKEDGAKDTKSGINMGVQTVITLVACIAAIMALAIKLAL